MPFRDEFVMYCQNFDFKIRRDHHPTSVATFNRSTKKEPILGYNVSKNDEKKLCCSRVKNDEKRIMLLKG